MFVALHNYFTDVLSTFLYVCVKYSGEKFCELNVFMAAIGLFIPSISAICKQTIDSMSDMSGCGYRVLSLHVSFWLSEFSQGRWQSIFGSECRVELYYKIAQANLYICTVLSYISKQFQSFSLSSGLRDRVTDTQSWYCQLKAGRPALRTWQTLRLRLFRFRKSLNRVMRWWEEVCSASAGFRSYSTDVFSVRRCRFSQSMSALSSCVY